MNSILVVDDDKSVLQSISRSLEYSGYEVRKASNGVRALEEVRQNRPDIMLLDVMMPGMSGIEVLQTLREGGDDLPVLLLTARDSVADRVAGLDAGADDYLNKPFALEELVARVRTVLRRYHAEAKKQPPEDDPYTFADIVMDPTTRIISRGGMPLNFTRTEYQLMELFMFNQNRVLAREEMLEAVWGYEFPTSGNALEVYIGYLRKKLEAGGRKRLIHTVRGVGYVLREEP